MTRVNPQSCWTVIRVNDDPQLPSFFVLRLAIIQAEHRVNATLIGAFNDCVQGPGVLQDLAEQGTITEDDRGRLVLCLQGMNDTILLVHPCACRSKGVIYRVLRHQSMIVEGEQAEEIAAPLNIDDLIRTIERMAAESVVTEEVRDRVIIAVREGITAARGKPPAKQTQMILDHLLGAPIVVPENIHNN